MKTGKSSKRFLSLLAVCLVALTVSLLVFAYLAMPNREASFWGHVSCDPVDYDLSEPAQEYKNFNGSESMDEHNQAASEWRLRLLPQRARVKSTIQKYQEDLSRIPYFSGAQPDVIRSGDRRYPTDQLYVRITVDHKKDHLLHFRYPDCMDGIPVRVERISTFKVCPKH